MKYLRFFHELGKKDVQIAGGKGASLGEMTQAGFPVPPGFVITTNAFKTFHNKTLPAAVKEELLTAFEKLNTTRIAVRSSAIAEDSSSASWAGQLESYLNVDKEGLLEAIKKCWKSINSQRAVNYAVLNKISKDKLVVAVVIQKMVASEASGVMFTINPVTNNPNEIMIEACYGLGELLVQGEITPDNYVVDKETCDLKTVNLGSQKIMLTYRNGKNTKSALPHTLQNKQILTTQQIKTLAKLRNQIEKHYRSPQDIEWAIENEKVYIVQSRPITTIPVQSQKPITLLPPLPSKPKGVKYALTVPQSVLFADLSLQGNRKKYFSQAFHINYEPAYILIDAGGAMSWNYDTDEHFVNVLVGKKSVTNAVTQFIQTMERTGKNLDTLSQALSESYSHDEHKNLMPNLTAYWEAYKLYNTSLFSFWNVEQLLSAALIKLLKQAKRNDEIKNGLTRFFKPHKQNYFVLERLELEKILQRFSKTKRARQFTLSTLSSELRLALEAHGKSFGFLLAPFNLGRPPSLASILQRINEIAENPKNNSEFMPKQDSFDDLPPQIQILGQLARELTYWKTHRLDIFSLADSRMQEHYKTAAKTLLLPLELLFFMTSDEIKASLTKGKVLVNKQILEERQKTYCLLLYKGHIDFHAPSIATPQQQLHAKDSVIKGVVASGGKATGKVKIVKSESDIKRFKQGEVLVTAMTRPEYGAALDRAVAFITDEGGLMSHAAIISREMGKPCIVGTQIATQALKDGDLVEVDAEKGTVKLLK